jgi:hypothetical protein
MIWVGERPNVDSFVVFGSNVISIQKCRIACTLHEQSKTMPCSVEKVKSQFKKAVPGDQKSPVRPWRLADGESVKMHNKGQRESQYTSHRQASFYLIYCTKGASPVEWMWMWM